MTTEQKKIVVTLSDRAPVKIDESEWPVISVADWHDGQERCKSSRHAAMRVREHADGRRLVYGWTKSQWANERSHRAGFLLERGDDTVRAIRRVAGVLSRHELADDCIADLPPEQV